ncbi:MAG: hypothetical protein KBD63_01670 [Bacteriovoracaceae bacterium]|nr:hypothetical protein [Bacteriovoracaceae bacterium]
MNIKKIVHIFLLFFFLQNPIYAKEYDSYSCLVQSFFGITSENISHYVRETTKPESNFSHGKKFERDHYFNDLIVKSLGLSFFASSLPYALAHDYGYFDILPAFTLFLPLSYSLLKKLPFWYHRFTQNTGKHLHRSLNEWTELPALSVLTSGYLRALKQYYLSKYTNKAQNEYALYQDQLENLVESLQSSSLSPESNEDLIRVFFQKNPKALRNLHMELLIMYLQLREEFKLRQGI